MEEISSLQLFEHIILLLNNKRGKDVAEYHLPKGHFLAVFSPVSVFSPVFFRR
jgi:hypothetical protein